ncbi:hypothetical protein GN156_00915 [bacterium LRH843]|nr:hypothetical protein [bacterium LRH843]
MATIFLIISLLLHGVAFLWIMALRGRQSDVSRTDIQQMKNEMADLLLAYTEEMKAENERLIEQIKGSSQRVVQAKPAEEIKMEKRVMPSENKPVIAVDRYKDYQPPVAEPEEAIYEQSLTAQVLALKKQGLSAKHIAKTLNIGTGEVELMLKFNQ